MASVALMNKALLFNCLEPKNTSLFEQILQDLLGDTKCCSDQCHLWSVDNKYYTAKILLQSGSFDETGKVNAKLDDYEAVVIVFDCIQKLDISDSLATIWREITSYLSEDGAHFEAPAVCLLVDVSHHLHQDQQGEQPLKWCVENGFELIEWTLKDQKPGEEECESGSVRLAEALQAHIWPHITMKSGNLTTAAAAASNKLLPESEQSLAGLDSQDPEGESFEDLFSKFAEMKAHAQQLPQEQRKAYAEKVVLAFWDAIGGDQEEVKDLTES